MGWNFEKAVDYAADLIHKGKGGYEAIGEASNKYEEDFRDIADALRNRVRNIRLSKEIRDKINNNVDNFLKERSGEKNVKS